MLGEWPPAYDYEQLQAQIRELINSDTLVSSFYEPWIHGYPLCQGDILALDSDFPFIHSDGKPATKAGPDYWLLLSNTCDLQRELTEVKWGQLIYLHRIPRAELTPDSLKMLKSYQTSRRFYVPPWDGSDVHYIADFLRPVSVDRTALTAHSEVVARLTYTTWVLLHSCLVRYLVRADGRET